MSPPPIPLEIQQAAEHLPAGASLIFQEVTWDDYECLLTSLEERTGLLRAELEKPFDSKFKS